MPLSKLPPLSLPFPVYERSLNGKNVIVMTNGSSKDVNLPLERYSETLNGKTSGKDIITGRTITLSKEAKLAPRKVLVMEM